MKDPIKIIHKFKNNNRRIQYIVYIFVGPFVPDNIMDILNNIHKKDFYTTLNTISKSNYDEMEKLYGEFWYEKFFVSYHINSQINNINNTSIKKKSLETKYGKEWYNKHINNPPTKKISYSFSSLYYNYLLTKNKIKTQTKKPEMDFRTYGDIEKKIPISLPNDSDIIGGADTDEESSIGQDTEYVISEEKTEDEETEPEITQEEFEEQVEEDFNLDEITKLYSTLDIESNKTITETSKLISQAINDKKWEKEIDNLEKKYDDSLDNITYDTKLEDIYIKHYITDQYIFKDDTIKIMKNKISMSIPISNKFGKSIKMLPETQYFWSEYEFERKTDHVMLGQKWIRRNELLKIDIIPNENLKIYEKLRNNLSYLKDSFGQKIKREDDENNIIRYYEDFITMNEIFMLDIYNDLGMNYNPEPEEKRNVYDVYVNIYYPFISSDRLDQIILLLNGKNTKELDFIELQFATIRNDIKLETEIQNTVEKAKLNIGNFSQLFSNNHVILSTIYVNIQDPKNITGTTSKNKFNLYRIFDNFIVNDKYPFIQYQTPDTQLTYKFYTLSEKDNKDVLSKWFENTPYGINFKIKITNNKIKTNDKYISISLQDTGRIEYKITWKEDDEAVVDDIVESYNYVRDLLKKINSENKKIKFILPQDDRFKYAFINTIQKFTIPEKFKINHNDLSEFSRFFFPYVSLVIEPPKRKSKKKDVIDDVSKFGTYLRYKRISKYENRTRIHMRILYFLRNYELNDRELIDEIAKQFNIIPEFAAKELDYVREKYQNVIRKSKKMLHKLKALPNTKPPGIGIDIQGRDKERYKIRITGARNKEQLDEIIDFMKVLIYLYVETYLYKKKEYQKLKDTLIKLTNIAKRRNKVIELVDFDSTKQTVRAITSLDKARLGFRPEKGQNQWTRSCQNSGNDKKRRPTITPGDQLEKLIKDGYKLNKKTGYYEKEVEIKIKGKKYNSIIKAIKLSGDNNTFNYFSCDPSENNENMYIGFLARGNNPNDLCMPCCFKKDHLTSVNKEKRDYFLQCVGEKDKTDKEEKVATTNLGDKLYILQETNKVQDGRFIYLPKYLDIFFNKIWNHDHKIKNHYLLESKSGYFFKYTVKHDYYYFLSAIANIYEKSIDDIIQLMVNFMQKDKDNKYFTYLNNGDISESFKEKDKYIEYINSSNYLEYDIVGELLALPGVLSSNGINYYILNKQTNIIKKALEKEIVNERYFLDCLNPENYNDLEKDRDIIIFIKEDKYYFPIYKVIKDEKINKKILLEKYFRNQGPMEKIITELKNYHSKSCKNTLINQITFNTNLIAKNIINKIKNNITKQYIDDRHKCKYLELDNGLLLPVVPSGISYDYPFTNLRNIKSSKWLNIKNTIKYLEIIEKNINLDYKPKTIFYDKKNDSNINIISLLLENDLILPVMQEQVKYNDIKKLGLIIRFQPLEETINNEILNYNNQTIYDDRFLNVKTHNYNNESYNLYRLELSLFLEKNHEIKDKIINIVRNQSISLKDKKHELRKILFDIIDSKLATQYKNYEIKGGSNMASIVNKLSDLKTYETNNVRDYCEIHNKDKCNSNLHCVWKNDKCKLQLLENMAVDFVNKVIEEMLQDGIKFKEIIQEGEYYVSDIVDYSQYTNRNKQKIIKTSNFNINKLMSELFGKDKIPIIGRRQLSKMFDNNDEELPELVELGKQYIQLIIPNKDSIIRAYINSYYWINNPLYDIESRNLGYLNELQTNLTYLFKANIIDFIQKYLLQNDSNIKKYLIKYFKDDTNFFESTLNKFRKTSFNTDGKVELFILSHIIPLPIVVYDNFSNVKYLFLEGEIPITTETIKNFTAEKNINKTIFLKFDLENSNIPKNIYSIYYI